jgi:general secretion pathway protein G
MIVVVILGILVSLAIPSGKRALDSARIGRAATELRGLETEIVDHHAQTGSLPNKLNDMGNGKQRDPWDRNYTYLSFKGKNPPGKARKDLFGLPLNSDFDLYSKGVDGKSSAPVNSAKGKDDILRASNGAYVGLASQF